MEINLNAAEIIFDASGAEEIVQNVRTIITTARGSVPLDRNFGINIDVLDLPLEEAKGRLVVEYTEQIKRYESRARVSEVTFETDALQGKLYPKVVIIGV